MNRLFIVILMLLFYNCQTPPVNKIRGCACNSKIDSNIVIDSIEVYMGCPFLVRIEKIYNYNQLLQDEFKMKVIKDTTYLSRIKNVFIRDRRFLKYINGENRTSKYFEKEEMIVTQILKFNLSNNDKNINVYIFFNINNYKYWDYPDFRGCDNTLYEFVKIFNEIK